MSRILLCELTEMLTEAISFEIKAAIKAAVKAKENQLKPKEIEITAEDLPQ